MEINDIKENKKVLGLRSLPKKQVFLTMAGVLLAMFLSSLDQTIVSSAMPRIIADLNGFAHYTWVTTAYIITSAVVIPITGKLTDMYGRKPFYIAGLIIFTLASLLSGLSNNMFQLILFRGVQGIGAGVMISNAFTVIGDIFPPAERGKYQGLVSAVFGLSAILGPLLGGVLTDSLSWHWVFFINVPLGVVIIALFFFFFPDYRPDTRLHHKVDYAGMVALVFTVVPLMLALSWGGVVYDWLSWQIIGMLLLSVVMLFVFLKIERNSPEAIMPPSLFKNRIVAIAEMAVFLTAFGMYGTITFAPLFFQGVLGTSATVSGSLLIPMTLGQVTGSFISGQLLSRAGGRYRLQGAAGIFIMSIGLLLLSLMDSNTSYGMAIFNTVLAGFGLGITMPLFTIAVQNAVPYNMLGVATSSVPFVRSIGGSVGLAIFGATLTGRFVNEFNTLLPSSLRMVLSPEEIAGLASNPQSLVSPEAQMHLRDLLMASSPQGNQLYEELSQILRQSLSHSLSTVFLIGFIILVVALVIQLFIKEIPLRKEHSYEVNSQQGEA
jgi:EmrB/QacA subfamily drug resistance transporter